ncbi:MAG: hypothetical protein ABUK01_09905 [Leptospirales bacterium]
MAGLLLLQRSAKKMNKWLFVVPLLFGPMIAVISGPYVSFINALLPPQRSVLLKTKVVKKYIDKIFVQSTTLSLPYIVIDYKDPFGENYKIQVQKDEFNKISIGDTIEKNYYIGGLGYIYYYKKQRDTEKMQNYQQMYKTQKEIQELQQRKYFFKQPFKGDN